MIQRKIIKSQPIVIVNFKTYEQATGEKALKLAQVCEKVAIDCNANIAVAVQAADIYRVAKGVSIPVFAQHMDPAGFGSNTGFILPQSVKEAGAVGTLLNHSEHRTRIDQIKTVVNIAKDLGLITVVCANDDVLCKSMVPLNPDYIAVEPPELIGGDVSVSSAKPKIVSDSVKFGSKKLKNIIVGAGVKTNKDFKKSIKLGACGILLASGITKAKDPEKVLRELIKGIYK